MSMTREQMLGYMANPALLNEKTLAELKEILDEFPYFQTEIGRASCRERV
jgi:hypothetical protein